MHLLKVIIYHSQPLFCEGFYEEFRQKKGFCLITKSSTIKCLYEKLSQDTFDVVCFKEEPDGVNVKSLVNKLSVSYPAMKIIILTMSRDAAFLTELLTTKARGIIHASTEGEEIKTGIFAVMEGKIYLCPEITTAIADSKAPLPVIENDIEKALGLCPKEKAVLKLRAQLKSIKDIMEELKIKKSTAKQYSRAVYQKVKKAGYKNVTDFVFKTGYMLQALNFIFWEGLF